MNLCFRVHRSQSSVSHRSHGPRIVGVRIMGVLVCLWLAPVSHATLPSPRPSTVHDVIVDTDFGLPPVDDSFAVGLLLNSPDVRVLGITTVAGNQPLDTANGELAVFLERMGRAEV